MFDPMLGLTESSMERSIMLTMLCPICSPVSIAFDKTAVPTSLIILFCDIAIDNAAISIVGLLSMFVIAV